MAPITICDLMPRYYVIVILQVAYHSMDKDKVVLLSGHFIPSYNLHKNISIFNFIF